MGAKDFPEPLVAPLGEQMKVHFAQRRQEAVGVGDGVRIAAFVAHLQPVVDEVGERQRHGEQSGFDVLHGESVFADDRDDFDRVRAERPDDGVVAVLVGAQDAVRVMVRPGHQALQVGGVRRQVGPGELISSTHVRSPPAQQRDSGFLRYEGHVDDVGDRLPRIDADVI